MTINSYTRENPFLASIKERHTLCIPPSDKETYHLVLDISNSGILYTVGDSVAIAPRNDEELVNMTLKSMKALGTESVIDKRSGKQMSLYDLLKSYVSITDVNRKLLKFLMERQKNQEKRSLLEHLHAQEQREALKGYLERYEVWDLLQAHNEVDFAPEEWSELLLPLLPRFYSIASSQRVHPDEIHLTIALLHYESEQELRKGVCSHYLWQHVACNQAEIPIYIQPHKGFTVPLNGASPIIMIGPGTGVAPFRAFMEERVASGSMGENWLFFGECHREHHYFYKEYWEDLVNKGILELDLAFSRDQKEKVYVQHLMEAKGDQLFSWLEAGAVIYVCGDAHRMARDVEEALLRIIGRHHPDPKQYLKGLRSSGRYLRDVY